MANYLVSFTLGDGTAYTKTVQALTAMLAVRIAHNLITDDGVNGVTLRNTVAIVCTLQE